MEDSSPGLSPSCPSSHPSSQRGAWLCSAPAAPMLLVPPAQDTPQTHTSSCPLGPREKPPWKVVGTARPGVALRDRAPLPQGQHVPTGFCFCARCCKKGVVGSGGVPRAGRCCRCWGHILLLPSPDHRLGRSSPALLKASPLPPASPGVSSTHTRAGHTESPASWVPLRPDPANNHMDTVGGCEHSSHLH